MWVHLLEIALTQKSLWILEHIGTVKDFGGFRDELNALALWDENVRVDSITHSFKNASSLYLGSGCINGRQLNSQHLRLLMESSGLQQHWAALQTSSPGLWTAQSCLPQLQARSRYWSMLVPFSLMWQSKLKKRKVCLGSQFEGTIYHGGKVMAAGV